MNRGNPAVRIDLLNLIVSSSPKHPVNYEILGENSRIMWLANNAKKIQVTTSIL